MSLQRKLLTIDISVAAICMVLWILPISSIYYGLDNGMNGNNQHTSSSIISAPISVSTPNIIQPQKVTAVDFKAWEKEGVDVSGKGIHQYYIIDFQGEKWIALKGKANKLAKLVVEMGKEDKKVLTTGETWSLGSGYELTINAIEARTTPRQVWFTLKKDGVVVDEGIGQSPERNTTEAKEKAVYYSTRTILGESNVLFFTIYVNTIFSGATADMVQFKYAWLIDETTAKDVTASTATSAAVNTLSADQKTFTNSFGMEFVQVPAGEFDMGSQTTEKDRFVWEGPIHRVKISNGFYMGKYEVTQKQWRDVMGNNPSYFKGDELPVEGVSWNDVQEFIKKLNEKEGTDKYRIPSEAEWEYAARAGTTTRYFFGDDESKVGDYAWFDENSDRKTHPVGQKKPNPWGLYDIYGNVWEWVQDTFHDNYRDAPTDGGEWKLGGSSNHVIRGASWYNNPVDFRSASRNNAGPGSSLIGFRLVMILPTSTNTPIAQISTPTVIAKQQQPSTTSSDIVPTTYLSYVNNGNGFYQVRNLDKPQPRKFTYENSVLNIGKGDTIIWENDEVKETLNVISDQKLWNSEIGQIKAGRRINYTFYNHGTYTFHIEFEGLSKRQTIVVTPTASQISIPISAVSSVTTSTDQKTITNSIGMELVLIPAGEFDMGSPSNEVGRNNNEGPVHRVKISKAFYMGKYEVTKKQWLDVMGSKPNPYDTDFKGDDSPVNNFVSWDSIQEFISNLNQKEGINKYRLPTEAEWEYAARAGTTTRYSFGDDESILGDYAWCNGKSGDKSHEVGQKKPNPWALYDMHGNVWEWVQDIWHRDYNGAPTNGSAWEGKVSWLGRVVRGGGWSDFPSAGGCRSAIRSNLNQGASSSQVGFRLLKEL